MSERICLCRFRIRMIQFPIDVYTRKFGPRWSDVSAFTKLPIFERIYAAPGRGLSWASRAPLQGSEARERRNGKKLRGPVSPDAKRIPRNPPILLRLPPGADGRGRSRAGTLKDWALKGRRKL